jgi:acylpyruvate hydrolase
MRLATIRANGTTRAVRADGDMLVDLGAADLGEFLAHEDWAERAAAATAASGTCAAATADFAPVVPRLSKVVCVGLNYRNHICSAARQWSRRSRASAAARTRS